MSKVAIIMRSKNEMPYVQDVFQALFTQDYQDFALYNIDSGSTDGTVEFIKENNSLKTFEITAQQYLPGVVLNQMIAKTSASIIVLLNADAIPQSATWLSRLLYPILYEKIDGTISRQIARPDAHFIVQEDYRRAYDIAHFPGGVLCNFFSAVACAFKREVWEETKFYTQGYAEDLIWFTESQKKGRLFKLIDDSIVEHSHNYSLKDLYHKRYRHGVAAAHFSSLQLWHFCKEIIRDTARAALCGEVQTIPYNLLYRAAIYLGYYRGSKERFR